MKKKSKNLIGKSIGNTNLTEKHESNEQIIRVLLCSYTGLGNFILKTPMIKKIITLYPNAKIDLIGGGPDRAEFALKDEPFIGKVHKFDRNWGLIKKIKFYLGLKKYKYKYVFVPFDDESRFMFLGAIISGASKIFSHIIVGRGKTDILKLVLSKVITRLHLVPYLQSRHEIDLNYDLLQASINRPLKRNYQTYCKFSHEQDTLGLFSLKKDRYVVIQPGARSGKPTPKRWSIANFVNLIKIMSVKYPKIKIVAIGNKFDNDQYIKPLIIDCPDIINTAGSTTIEQVADIMRFAIVNIVHDSGALHIGGAVNAKMIALYGPTDYTRTKPLNSSSAILFSKNKSFAEMYNMNISEDELIEKYGEDFCMDSILPEDVINVMENFINHNQA